MSEYKRLAAIIKGGSAVRMNGKVIKDLKALTAELNPTPEEVDPEEVSESAKLQGKLNAAEKRIAELESELKSLQGEYAEPEKPKRGAKAKSADGAEGSDASESDGDK